MPSIKMFMSRSIPVKLFGLSFCLKPLFVRAVMISCYVGFNTSTIGDKIFTKKRENQEELNKTRKF